MAATFAFSEDNGPAVGSPAKGTNRTPNITDCNWKNIDDTTTAYNAAPIAIGANSFEKFLFGYFIGTFTTILNGLWAHTAGSFGTGITLKGTVSSTYTTPGTATNAALTTDMTAVTAIGSGQAVLFGGIGPEAAGKASSSVANPTYSQYLITQIQSTGSVAPGDTATVTLSFQYSEN